MAYMDSYYVLSLNILKALGGDTSIVYPDADAIWDEINKIYNNAGNRFDIVPLEKNITENGQYDYYPDGDADAFMPVNINVNVPQKYTDEQVFEIESNAIQQGYNQGYVEGEAEGKLTGREEGYTDGYNTGYGTGVTDGGNTQKAKLVDITITENGIYTREDGYKTVTVEIEGGISEEEVEAIRTESFNEGYAAGESDGYSDGYSEGLDDGAEDQKALLTTIKITENGIYEKEDGYKTVTVEVAGSGGGDTGKPKIYNGFRFTGNNNYGSVNAFRQIDFSQYDWSSVYDTEYFFADFCRSLSANDGWVDADFENFRQHYNGKMLNCSNLFSTSDYSWPPLIELPNFGNMTNECVNMSYMCYQQNKMTSADNIANWNTSSVIDMYRMFYACTSLTSIPQFDTSNVTNMENMFYNCTGLTSIPQLDTSKVTAMNGMFQRCSGLTSIPQLDMSNVTSLSSMFHECTEMTELHDCNTKSMKTWSNWLPPKVQKVGVIDCDSTTNVSAMLTTSSVLTEIGGFRNLGMQSSVSNTSGTSFLYNVPNLTYESLINIFNLLYDRASAGYSILTLKLTTAQMSKLSDDDKAIAINKGWSLSS